MQLGSAQTLPLCSFHSGRGTGCIGIGIGNTQCGDAWHSRGRQLTLDLGWWRQLRASLEVTEEEAEPQVCHLGCSGNMVALTWVFIPAVPQALAIQGLGLPHWASEATSLPALCRHS